MDQQHKLIESRRSGLDNLGADLNDEFVNNNGSRKLSAMIESSFVGHTKL